MKKMISLILAGTLILGMTGCNSSKSSETTTSETTSTPTTTTEATTTTESTTEQTTEETTTETTWTDPVETDKIIVVEVPNEGYQKTFELFLESNPDFAYEFVEHQEEDFETFKGSSADIILSVQREPRSAGSDWMEHTDELMPYDRVFEDLESKLKDAGVPDGVSSYGRLSADGPLYALPLTASTNVFVYRKSIAKEVFGTDDPDQISEIFGGGTGNFDKFYEAARKLKEAGYITTPRGVDVFNPLTYANISKWINSDDFTVNMSEADYKLLADAFSYSADCTNDPLVNSGQQYDFSEAWYGSKIFCFYGDMLDVSLVLQSQGQKAKLQKDLGFCELPITVINRGSLNIFVNKNTEHRKLLLKY